MSCKGEISLQVRPSLDFLSRARTHGFPSPSLEQRTRRPWIRIDRIEKRGIETTDHLNLLCRPNLSASCFALVSGPGSLPGNGRYGMEEGQLLRCHVCSMNSRFASGKREASPQGA